MSPLSVCGILWMVWFVYWNLAALSVKKTRASEGFLARLVYVVPLGFGMFMIFHDPRRAVVHGAVYHIEAVRWLGVAFTAVGMAFSVWARVHLGRNWSGIITLKEGHQLIRSGPYAWVRHPIYTGFLTAAIGSAMAAGTGDAWVGVGAVLVSFLIKMRREEALMGREFGEEYARFKREVPALVPMGKGRRAHADVT